MPTVKSIRSLPHKIASICSPMKVDDVILNYLPTYTKISRQPQLNTYSTQYQHTTWTFCNNYYYYCLSCSYLQKFYTYRYAYKCYYEFFNTIGVACLLLHGIELQDVFYRHNIIQNKYLPSCEHQTRRRPKQAECLLDVSVWGEG